MYSHSCSQNELPRVRSGWLPLHREIESAAQSIPWTFGPAALARFESDARRRTLSPCVRLPTENVRHTIARAAAESKTPLRKRWLLRPTKCHDHPSVATRLQMRYSLCSEMDLPYFWFWLWRWLLKHFLWLLPLLPLFLFSSILLLRLLILFSRFPLVGLLLIFV